jgi:hypothetical protein
VISIVGDEDSDLGDINRINQILIELTEMKDDV